MLKGIGKLIVMLTLVSVFSLNGLGQNSILRYTSFSGNIGTSTYYGDLASSHDLINATWNSLRWHLGVGVSRPLTRHLSAELTFNWIRLGADDNNSNELMSYVRNLHFRNDLKEFSLRGIYTLIRKESNVYRRAAINPYLSAGVAYYFHNPKAKTPDNLGGNWVSLQTLSTEGEGVNQLYGNQYRLSGIALPIGFGISYKYNKHLDIGVELIYRMTFSDYLDDVSGLYPNPLLLQSPEAKALTNRSQELVSSRTGTSRTVKLIQLFSQEGIITNDPYSESLPLSAIGSSRGDSGTSDRYLTMSIKLLYHIPDAIKCPK